MCRLCLCGAGKAQGASRGSAPPSVSEPGVTDHDPKRQPGRDLGSVRPTTVEDRVLLHFTSLGVVDHSSLAVARP